jgi:hypothetical protein
LCHIRAGVEQANLKPANLARQQKSTSSPYIINDESNKPICSNTVRQTIIAQPFVKSIGINAGNN